MEIIAVLKEDDMSRINGKLLLFFRKNLVYIILALCIIAIGLSVTLVLVNKQTAPVANQSNNIQEKPLEDVTGGDVIVTPPVDEDEEPVSTVITFVMPVTNATRIEGYDELPVFNETLLKAEPHKGIDFFAEQGTSVLACYDGVIQSITTNGLTGTTIVINHGNELSTIYNSLDGEVEVTVGQTVKAGDVIGYVGETNMRECISGAHVHFETMENGTLINPEKYLVFAEK